MNEYYLETNPQIIAEYAGAEPAEIDGIIRCVKHLTQKYTKVHYVEIGVLYGGVFRRVIQEFGGKIKGIGIDLFEDFKVDPNNTHGGNVTSKVLLEEKLYAHGCSNFTLLKGDSIIVVPNLPLMDTCVCFIDGNHSYDGCKADFLNIYEKIKKGFILLHDGQFSEVNQVVKEVEYMPGITNCGMVWHMRIMSKNL